MVVWHEVGHVFAIQLSKNHVPRWFTEGLSEYETIVRRPEWRREEDQALFLALRRNKVPAVEQMNRAFTHADDARDMTTAYYASSQIMVFLAEKYGMPKIVAMLRAWGEGKQTPEVIRVALGVSGDELDRQFRAWLGVRLERYAKQYMPDLHPKPVEVAAKEAAASPTSAQAQVILAVSRLAAGDGPGALAALDAAQAIDPKSPDVHYARARMALGRKKAADGKKELEAIRSEGHDGYAVRMLLADIALGEKDVPKAIEHFEAAVALDPTQAEPLQALVDLARKTKDEARELRYLRLLAPIDQHDRRVWRRLLGKLVASGEWAEARKIGEGAMFVDIHGPETHSLYARALLGVGEPDRAIFEAESALLCGGLKNDVAAEANATLAEAYLKKGDRKKAQEARDEALRQQPTNARATALVIP
jgi:predicted Zn-dependent protease